MPPAPSRAGPPPTPDDPALRPPAEGPGLLAYFSRAGKNYYNSRRTRLTLGNTQVAADRIRQLISRDVYRIETVPVTKLVPTKPSMIGYAPIASAPGAAKVRPSVTPRSGGY